MSAAASAGRRVNWAGWAVAFSSSLAFSTTTPVSKAALGLGMHPATQNTVRFGIAAGLLGLTLALTSREKLRLPARPLLIAWGAGASIGVGALLYLAGLQRMDSSVAAMIFSLEPLMVLGLLALRGERFTYRQLIRLGLALAGVYLLIGPGGRVDLGGVGLMLLSCFTFALPIAVLQWFLGDFDARTVTFYMVTGMLTISLIGWLATGAEWHDPGWGGWAAILTIAVVGTFAARLLMVAAIGRLGSGQVALLIPVELMLSIVWSMLFLGDRLTLIQSLGGLLILLSASLSVIRLKRVPWRAPTELP